MRSTASLRSFPDVAFESFVVFDVVFDRPSLVL